MEGCTPPHPGAARRSRRALSLALRAGPSPKTAWEKDGGSLRSRLFRRGPGEWSFRHRPAEEAA